VTGVKLSSTGRKALFRSLLPDDRSLLAGLASVFPGDGGTGDGGTGAGVAVLDRVPNDYASSFPSEIVTCRLGDGRELRLLCKYEAGQAHASYGHRGNVAYEADVYRHVVQPLGSSAPAWYGTYVTEPAGDSWLVLEYVPDAVRVSHAPALSGATDRAAHWLGHFHAACAARLAAAAAGSRFLKRYDAEYYREWARRTALLADGLRDRYPWLAPLCERFARSVDPLLAAPTVIHGEFTPKNTLVQGERVCPVDWESAAVAAGEIDLASLTDGPWPPVVVESCLRAYQRARWPDGAPSDFARTLDLARLYWNFRWLGERLDWTTSERGSKRLGYLQAAGERLGMI
jgi:aminoglycoside phosphotransferase (APT) family kinase protein